MEMANPPNDPYGWKQQQAQIAANQARNRAIQDQNTRAAMYMQWQQRRPGQDPQAAHVPRPPRRKYIRRAARAIVFSFLTFAFMTAAISSYIHGQSSGYAPLDQASTATGHYPSPLPFALVGVFFGLLAFFQIRRILKVREL
jgi:hypothetical protein